MLQRAPARARHTLELGPKRHLTLQSQTSLNRVISNPVLRRVSQLQYGDRRPACGIFQRPRSIYIWTQGSITPTRGYSSKPSGGVGIAAGARVLGYVLEYLIAACFSLYVLHLYMREKEKKNGSNPWSGFPQHVQQRFLALAQAAAEGKLVWELRALTFSTARTLTEHFAHCVPGKVVVEHGALADPIKLADGREIQTVDTCLFAIRDENCGCTEVFVLAINADPSDPGVINAVMGKGTGEMGAKLGSEKVCSYMLVIRTGIIYGVGRRAD